MNYILIKDYFNKKNIVFLAMGLCIFLLNLPFFVWGIDKSNIVFFIPFVIISLFYLKKIREKDLIIITFFAIVFLYISISSSRNLFGYINALLFLIFFLVNDKVIIRTYNAFKLIFAISLLLSLTVYILIIFFSIPFNYTIIKPLNELKINNYVKYPFLVSEGFIGMKYLNIRFFGMFDEPGVVGSLVTILLFADNYNLKSKQNIIFFISGIFSFSFYFYLSSAVYFLLFSANKIRFFFALLFILFFSLTSNNEILSTIIWDRFKFEDKKLKGDNRSEIKLDIEFEKLIQSNEVFFGKGGNYTKKMELMGSSSYKLLIVDYGIVFMIILFFAFWFLAKYKIKDRFLIFIYLFLIIGMMYQRPGMIYFPGSFFLLVASATIIRNNDKFYVNKGLLNLIKN